MPRPDPGRLGLLHPEVLADPYPTYARLRATWGPFVWSDLWDSWLVTGHAECSVVLRHPALSADMFGPRAAQVRAAYPGQAERILELVRRQMIVTDPPHHTRLRAALQRALPPRVVEGLRPTVRALAERLLDAATGDQVDVMSALAYPLPATVIAGLLGVPDAHLERFTAWSKLLVDFVGTAALPEPSQVAAAESAMVAWAELFRELCDDHRRHPRDDLLQALLTIADDPAAGLSEDDLLSNSIFLMAAGHETTSSLIGSGLLALLRHPAELARLRADPGLVAPAVEEMLRYDPPVQIIGRRAPADLEVAGTEVRAGQRLTTFLGAANRDPRTFADPDRFDVGRAEQRHLAFGHGAHFCLGAPLARVEAQEAVLAVLGRWRQVELAGPAVHRPNPTFRALATLPVLARR